MRIVVLVRQPHQHRIRGIARALALASSRQRRVLQVDLLVAFERHVDRIERDDSREQRRGVRSAGDEIARRDRSLADAAGDRRGDAREFEIELRSIDSGARSGDARRRFARGVDARVVLFARDCLDVDELLAARRIGSSKLRASDCARQLGFGLRQLGAIRTRIDDEQQVAFAHRAALGEVHALDVAGDARPHFDGLDGFDPAGKFVPLRDLALERGRDGNLRRRDLRCRRRIVAAAAQSNERSEQHAGHGERGHHGTDPGTQHIDDSLNVGRTVVTAARATNRVGRTTLMKCNQESPEL